MGSIRQKRSVWTSSVVLLQIAAIAAIAAIFIVILGPLTGALAVASPVVYAFVAGVHGVGPMLASRWTRTPGAAILTAAFAGLLASPFTGLGPLLIVALVVPALVFEAVLKLSGYRFERKWVWYAAASAAGVTIFALSLPIIDATALTSVVFWATLACRVLSYALAGRAAMWLEFALLRAGVRRILPADSRTTAV